MTQHVWLSKLEAMDNVRFYASRDPEGLAADESVAATLNGQGDVVPDVAVPKSVRPAKAKTKPLGDLNLIRSRVFLIGQKTAEVVRQFDIGSGRPLPIAVEHANNSVTSCGASFSWNFGNKATPFHPEGSTG